MQACGCYRRSGLQRGTKRLGRGYALLSGGGDGRVLVWDPGDPAAGPAELGRRDGGVAAVAVLPDGRMVSGGGDGWVLVWDPGDPAAGPVELGRHDRGVNAVAVLPDGRVVSGGSDDRVRLWDVLNSSPGSLLACSAYALATSPCRSGARLFIGHAQGGISCWEVHAAAQNTPGARQYAG
jgi:WD40 repeat protein